MYREHSGSFEKIGVLDKETDTKLYFKDCGFENGCKMGYGGTNMYGFLLGTLNSLPKIGMLSEPIPCECRTGAKENDQGYVIDRYSLKVSGYSLKNFDGKTNITIYPMKTLQWLETNYGSEAVSQWIKSCPDTFGTACKVRQYSERPHEFYSCEIAQKAF